jgi:hypothetical protein
MVRRDALIEVGGFEEQFRRIFTDQVLYSKLCVSKPVLVSNLRLSRYRKHSGSAVALVKNSGEMRSARLAFLNWLESYLDHSQIHDRDVRVALRRARWKCLYPRFFRLQRHAKYRALVARELLRASARQTLPAPIHRRLSAQSDERTRHSR